MQMPPAEQRIIEQRKSLIIAFSKVVGSENVLEDETSLRTYDSDGLTAYKQLPMLVVLPANTAEVSAVMAICGERKVKIVPRGAGTSLSGGALPLADGVIIGTGRLNRILEVDFENRCAVVQPGVRNLAVSEAVDASGFFYAPDPSSQIICSVGGNVAENSGGVHCLKYGVTTNNILGVEFVTIDGEVMRFGGKHFDAPGYDLLGVITGSEGMLGLVTEVTVRILPKPPVAKALLVGFSTNESAGHCVANIIARGIIPAGLEMMDRSAVEAAEDYCNAGYPLDAEAVLICELDGTETEVDTLIDRVSKIAEESNATSLTISKSEEERERFWLGRKSAFPATARIAPDSYVMDGTIPRRKLAEVLGRITELSLEYGLQVVNVFHAGDGNLHPLIMFDANKPGELKRVEELGAKILTLCVNVGGVLTGEHGVGVEKRDLMPTMFTESDIQQQQRLKCAFDPDHLLNPGKVFPELHRCAELGQMHIHHDSEQKWSDIPRF